MGGSSYARLVERRGWVTNSRGVVVRATHSKKSKDVYRNNRLDGLHHLVEPNRNIVCTAENPIVVAVDVTGSMGTWPKIIWDKLPMFYGQIVMQGYLDDPAISFAAVGDANGDRVPLAVTDFAQGIKIDREIALLGLGGGGKYGVPAHETYELAALYYARCASFPNARTKPILFFTGDEAFYPAVNASQAREHLKLNVRADIPTADVFADLTEKYEVFLIHRTYDNEMLKSVYGVDRPYPGGDDAIVDLWASVIGRERILVLRSPSAIVDVMLGAIALVSGARTIDQYTIDMLDRDQDADRIEEVVQTLEVMTETLSELEARYAAAGFDLKGDLDELSDDEDGLPARFPSSTTGRVDGAVGGAMGAGPAAPARR